jgi:hypothetical protein
MNSRFKSFRGVFFAACLLTLTVFGCSGTQSTSSENSSPDSPSACIGCDSVDSQLKQSAIDSVDAALTVIDPVRVQMDNETATALFGVNFGGVPIAGLSLRTREGDSLATYRIEFSDAAKATSIEPSFDVAAAGEQAFAVHGQPATILSTQLIFLPTTKDKTVNADVVKEIEGLRLAWLVTLQNPTEEGSFPEIFSIYLDAQDGALIESRQEGNADEGFGYSRYSGFPTNVVSIEIAPLANNAGYELLAPSQGGRRTYSANTHSPTGPDLGRSPVVSTDVFFGNQAIAATIEQAFSGESVTETGETMAVDVHYGIGRTWDFFEEFFGRNGPFADGSPLNGYANTIRTAGLDTANAAYILNTGLYVFLPPTGASLKTYPGGHPEIISHEFAHAVVRNEIEPSNVTPPTGDHIREYLAFLEATAQIFSLVEKNWRANPPTALPGGVYADGGVPIWTAKDAWGWAPSGSDGVSLNFYCRQASVDAGCVGQMPIEAVQDPVALYTGAYQVAGILRQLFVYLSTGVPPSPSHGGSPSALVSPFLERGVTGIGMMNAAQFFYRSIAFSSVAYPDMRSFAGTLLARAQTETNFCSDTYKTIWDVLRAVNLKDAPIDRVSPTSLSIAVSQSTGNVNVTLNAVDPVDDSGFDHSLSRAVLKVNGNEVAQPQFDAAGHATVQLQISQFPATPWGNYSFYLEVEDHCKNIATKTYSKTIYSNRNVVVVQSGTPKQPKLTVTLSDGGALSSVKFTADNGFTYTDTASPFEVTLDTSTWTDGPHTITILAKDTAGNEFTTTKTITADNTAPAVTLTSSGSVPPFQLTATATDASPLTQTVFGLDATPFTTDTSAPFNASYTPTNNGQHVLTALVSDSFGNAGSASIPAPRDTVAPTAILTTQQTGLAVQLTAGGMVDTCGVNWSLFVDNTPIANGTVSSWTGALPNALLFPGTHVFSADINDNCGNSAHVQQSFFINSVPTVTIDPVQQDIVSLKHYNVTVRVIHDRPITSIVLKRTHGAAQTELVLGQWTSAAGELLPIRTFSIDTSEAGWFSGTREIQAIAIDNLGIPGQATSEFYVDNTAPVLNVSLAWDGAQGFTIHADANDWWPGSVDNMREVSAVVLSAIPTITRTSAPWVINTGTITPYDSFDIGFGAAAKDKSGNRHAKTLLSHATCATQNNVRTCSMTAPSLVEDITSYFDH